MRNKPKKKKLKKKTLAGRITRHIMFWLILVGTGVLGAITALIFLFSIGCYESCFRANLDSTVEYTRRILSDVYMATNNNVYHLEQELDKPDRLMADMERIVRNNTRIRSCGISFAENYYPQKGRWFCPYAWKKSGKKDSIATRNMGDAEHDYLSTAWFQEAMSAGDTVYWSKPFFDGHDAVTPLMACLAPIHDKKGRVVGILGADLSLEWVTEKLQQVDKENNRNTFILDSNDSRSFIIHRDGTFITHPQQEKIMKDNFFDHFKDSDDEQLKMLKAHIRDGEEYKEIEFLDSFFSDGALLFEGHSSFVIYAPIKHTSLMVVTVVKGRSLFDMTFFFLVVCMIFIIPALILLPIICYLSVRNVTRSLHKLARSADEVAKGDLEASLPIVKRNDEVKVLRDSFENMQHSLVKYIDDLKETTASKAAIENELAIAGSIQMAMLPKTFPPFPERSDIDIFGSLTPAKAVGGDLFDFFIRDEQLFFCVGDVSGKGIPASLVMAVTRSLLRNISAHTNQPGHILTAMNDTICDGNEKNMFVTIFIGVLSLGDGRLRYCNAGHDAPLLVGDDVTKLPVESNLPVGVMGGWEFKEQELTLAPGTTLFLYTDGLNEAENALHEQFGEGRMIDVTRRFMVGADHQAKTLVDSMTTAVRTFVGEAEQSDDLTMLAIRLEPLGTETK